MRMVQQRKKRIRKPKLSHTKKTNGGATERGQNQKEQQRNKVESVAYWFYRIETVLSCLSSVILHRGYDDTFYLCTSTFADLSIRILDSFRFEATVK